MNFDREMFLSVWRAPACCHIGWSTPMTGTVTRLVNTDLVGPRISVEDMLGAGRVSGTSTELKETNVGLLNAFLFV